MKRYDQCHLIGGQIVMRFLQKEEISLEMIRFVITFFVFYKKIHTFNHLFTYRRIVFFTALLYSIEQKRCPTCRGRVFSFRILHP